MSCTLLPKPSFEPGKRYRTREGWFVKLREFDKGSVYPLGGMFDRITGTHWWTSDGRWCHYSVHRHARDLMPGAVEDVPEYVDPPQVYGFHTQVANLRREMAALAQTIAGMAAKIEALNQRVEAAGRFIDARGNGLARRMDGIDERFERHGCTVANLNKKIDDGDTELARHIDGLDDRLDRIAIEVGGKVNAPIDIIEAILTGQGFDISPEPLLPAKPTIKGGWVNVYRYDIEPVLNISPIIFKTREQCDHEGIKNRIACIQIPDITEGEGL